MASVRHPDPIAIADDHPSSARNRAGLMTVSVSAFHGDQSRTKPLSLATTVAPAL